MVSGVMRNPEIMGGQYCLLKGAMRSAGLIEYPMSGHIGLTEFGADHAEAPTSEISRDAFHEAVRAKLSGPQLRLLNPLIEAYPAPLSSDELATAADYSTSSSGFANLKGNMRSLGFIDYPTPGYVRAEDWLFP